MLDDIRLRKFLYFDEASGRGRMKVTNSIQPESSIELTDEEFDAIGNALEWSVVDGKPVHGVSLDLAKESAWVAVKAARAAAEFGPFTWNGQVFDGDSESQRRLATAAQLAAAQPEHYLVTWTLADNTTYALNAQMLQLLSLELATQIAGYYARARDLRAQIEAASTVEEVAAVSW